MLNCYVLGLDWPEPMMLFMLHIICSCIFLHTYFQFFIFLYFYFFSAFLRVFLSPSLLLALVCCMAPRCKSIMSQNPLHSGASSSSSPSDLTPSHIKFRDDKAHKEFLENFSRRGFHSKCKVVLLDFSGTDLPTIIYSRGWVSLCCILVTCPSMIIQEFYFNMHGFDYSIPHFITRIWAIRIVGTPNIVFEVLHVPRVAHLDYRSCDHLRTVSKYELSSLFFETPSLWGDRQNTPCSGLAKGPRFLNMVITFVLYPLSYYSSITKPRAIFLLSLLTGLSIDFPSHFILSLIDVYRNIATRDKLIFLLVLTWLLRHFSVSYPKSPHFSIMCAIDAATVRRSEA